MDYFDLTDDHKALYAASARAFALECEGKYEEAIEAHKNAILLLRTFFDDKVKDKIENLRRLKLYLLKLHLLMFEAQAVVHHEREMYLGKLVAKGSFEEVFVIPTIAGDELKVEDGQPRSLSLNQKTLSERAESNSDMGDRSAASGAARQLLGEDPPPFSTTLNLSLQPIMYHISFKMEGIEIGSLLSLYVKDRSNRHTMWVMLALQSDVLRMESVVLRRASDLMPGRGAVHVDVPRTQSGSFKLQMKSCTGAVKEIIDQGEKKKCWSPRRFDYGGCRFVWKGQGEGSMFSQFQWETLFETKRVWQKERSKSGKIKDEIVGPRLCWGERNGNLPDRHKLYFAAGLDQHFQEHLLASQLARYICWRYVPHKNAVSVETSLDASADDVERRIATLVIREAALKAAGVAGEEVAGNFCSIL